MQPTRPSRAIRSRQDIGNANHTASKASIKSAAVAAAALIPAVGQENAGHINKAEAKRKPFVVGAGVSSKQAYTTATAKTTALKGGVSNRVVLKEEDQKAVKNALSKPAQRATGGAVLRSTASMSSVPQGSGFAKTTMPGPARRIVKKTEVYADKRPTPPKAAVAAAAAVAAPKKTSSKVSKSPRSKAGNIIQREARKVGAILSGKLSLRGSKNDVVPVISHKLALSHIQDDNAQEQTDEDATDVEDEEEEQEEAQHPAAAPLESLSDEDEFYGDEDDTQYTSARPNHAGDNTTGVTAQLLYPRFTNADKRELLEASKGLTDIDEDDRWDITMVAEYGDDIFEYMRELEVRRAA